MLSHRCPHGSQHLQTRGARGVSAPTNTGGCGPELSAADNQQWGSPGGAGTCQEGAAPMHQCRKHLLLALHSLCGSGRRWLVLCLLRVQDTHLQNRHWALGPSLLSAPCPRGRMLSSSQVLVWQALRECVEAAPGPVPPHRLPRSGPVQQQEPLPQADGGPRSGSPPSQGPAEQSVRAVCPEAEAAGRARDSTHSPVLR